MATRRPLPAYLEAKRNGFRESATQPVDDITRRHVRLAHYFLENKGVYVPTPDTLRQLGEAKSPPVETIETIDAKIDELKKQHVKDLQTLFGFQLAEYHQELIDHRISHDVSAYMDIDDAYPDQVEFKKALDDLDVDVLKMDRFKRDIDDALSTLRYTYVKTLANLVARRSWLRTQDDAARQKRNAWFPQTIPQYGHITERDVQLRVARFLTSPSTEQDRMMDEFGWAYRAVQPLLSVYKSDAGFKKEVEAALSGLTVTDPRRRTLESAREDERKPPFFSATFQKLVRDKEDEPVFTRFAPVS